MASDIRPARIVSKPGTVGLRFGAVVSSSIILKQKATLVRFPINLGQVETWSEMQFRSQERSGYLK